MKQIKGLIFDYDGTLVDSMHVWDEVDREYVRKHRIQTDLDIGQAVRNFSFRECADFFIKEFRLSDPPEVIMAEWNRMAREKYAGHILLKEGVREYLDACRNAGCRMAILTSNHPENVRVNLKFHGLEAYFSHILTADEVGYNKTQPELFAFAANALGLPPSACVVFDDILSAVTAAKGAGLMAVGVFDARTTAEDTARIKAVADGYITAFRELSEDFHDSFTHSPLYQKRRPE